MFNPSFRLLIVSMLAFSPLIGEQSSEQMRKSSLDFEVCPLIPNHNRQKKCHRSHKKFFKCCEKGPKGPRGPAGPKGDRGPGPLLDYASFVSLTSQTLDEGDLVKFETVLVNGLDGSTGETSSPGVIPDIDKDVFTIQVAGDYAILFGASVAFFSSPLIQDSDFANSAPPIPKVAYFVIQKNGLEIPGGLVAVEPPNNQSIPVATAIFVANLDVNDTISVQAVSTTGTILLPLPVPSIPSQTAYIAFARLGP